MLARLSKAVSLVFLLQISCSVDDPQNQTITVQMYGLPDDASTKATCDEDANLTAPLWLKYNLTGMKVTQKSDSAEVDLYDDLTETLSATNIVDRPQIIFQIDGKDYKGTTYSKAEFTFASSVERAFRAGTTAADPPTEDSFTMADNSLEYTTEFTIEEAIDFTFLITMKWGGTICKTTSAAVEPAYTIAKQ